MIFSIFFQWRVKATFANLIQWKKFRIQMIVHDRMCLWSLCQFSIKSLVWISSVSLIRTQDIGIYLKNEFRRLKYSALWRRGSYTFSETSPINWNHIANNNSHCDPDRIIMRGLSSKHAGIEDFTKKSRRLLVKKACIISIKNAMLNINKRFVIFNFWKIQNFIFE